MHVYVHAHVFVLSSYNFQVLSGHTPKIWILFTLEGVRPRVFSDRLSNFLEKVDITLHYIRMTWV